MLCPKCGYISFDNLTSCSKCHHELSEIKNKLQGTTVQVEKNFFLGSVNSVKNEQPVNDYVETEGAGTENQADEIYQKEDNDLALDLEATPPIDLSETAPEPEPDQEEKKGPAPTFEDGEPITLKEPLEETAATPEAELSLSGINLQPEEEIPAENEIEMAVDADALTLEIDDQPVDLILDMKQPVEAEKEKEETKADQPPIDLKQIDLSDLIHSLDHAPESKQNIEKKDAAKKQGETDLTLEMEVGDKTDEQKLEELGDEENDQENSLLDLTLELDETKDVDLSLEDILEDTDTDKGVKG